jgi:anaphase-promoting complex subunit 3
MGCSGCAMILARCCEKLGRFSEGQAALQRAMSRGNPMSESGWRSGELMIALPTLDIQASAATAYLTLASLSHKGKVTAVAFENYKKALLEDPWSWEAFTGLCDIGQSPSPLLVACSL